MSTDLGIDVGASSIAATDEDQQREQLLADLRRLQGTQCAACSATLCGHETLMSVVFGCKDQPRCLDCLARQMGHDRASVRDLRVIGAAAAPAPKVSVHVELQQRDSTPAELNVIGCTVDEALTRAERFMDEALLNEQHVLRFVHGHGTGQLRRAIGQFLRQHPLVATVTQAPPNQGGGGVTVAELKD